MRGFKSGLCCLPSLSKIMLYILQNKIPRFVSVRLCTSCHVYTNFDSELTSFLLRIKFEISNEETVYSSPENQNKNTLIKI